MARSRLPLIVAVLLVVLLGAGAIWWVASGDEADSEARSELTGSVLERACDVPRSYINRIWRGYDPERSEELAIVPREPNYVGSFDLTSHSGPWDYLQRVPLTFYGPGFISSFAEVFPGKATVADIYPVVGKLVNVETPERGRQVPGDLLLPIRTRPRLIVVVVWDGTGRATLDEFPNRWPTLQRLSTRGTTFPKGVVGTSPSVTSAVHSTLGTGAWPRKHGVIGNELRLESGGLAGTFEELSADQLRLTTFADEVDLAFDNRSKVGMLAWNKWHLGMLGHGKATPGGDRDELALIHYGGGGLKVNSGGDFAPVPGLQNAADPHEELEKLDGADGSLDDKWLGNDITLGDEAEWNAYSNPAWAEVQTKLALEMLEKGKYGRDDVPDVWLTNFKMTDLAAHTWGGDSQEMAEVLSAQDKALGEIVDYLDRNVENYALALTADHGSAPLPDANGAWPINQDELLNDVDENFGAADDQDLIESSAAAAYFVDAGVAETLDVSVEEIAAFLNGYTIEQNWSDGELPEGYEGRGEEQVFTAAFPTEDLEEIRRCASS